MTVDLYRPEVKTAIEDLRQSGKQVVMCTGDADEAAVRIATDLGFPECTALTTGDVAAITRQLQKMLDQDAHSVRPRSST